MEKVKLNSLKIINWKMLKLKGSKGIYWIHWRKLNWRIKNEEPENAENV